VVEGPGGWRKEEEGLLLPIGMIRELVWMLRRRRRRRRRRVLMRRCHRATSFLLLPPTPLYLHCLPPPRHLPPSSLPLRLFSFPVLHL
jgi:hypothetical protein